MSVLDSPGLLAATICVYASMLFALRSGVEYYLYKYERRQAPHQPNNYDWNHELWFRIHRGAAIFFALVCITLLIMNREAFEQFVTDRVR